VSRHLFGAPFIEEQTEDMLMIDPPSGTLGAKVWHIQNILLTLMFMLLSNTSSLQSKILPWWTYLK
jgi:hypothetical protein